MVEELKLAIKVDDDAIEQSLLKQFANAEKMANKVVLTFNNIDLDDKAIEAKFKEMQKMAGKNPIDLSIDKSSIEMLSAISKQLGNIFDIAKGKSLIDSSATVSEINKITQATKELNKAQTGSENIQSKSFTTKNKTEAYNQLKQTADVFKKFYGNEEAMHTKAGTEAAYAYYKAYEEALKKGVAESKLQRVTVDIDPTDSFFTAEKLVYDRMQQYDNKLHYGGTSDLTEEITLLESRLSKFSEAYSKVKVNLGEAPITPDIIKNIEEYVRYIEIAEARAKDADLMGFTKEDIDGMKDLANMYLGFATEDAIKENEKYISSLKEVKKEKENVDASLNKSQISDMDSSVVEQQNKIQEELKETQKQAEQTSESLSKIGDGNKSNISSGTQMKDVFQGDDKAVADASTTTIKEESKALKQVSNSAKEAANAKEKFADANKEVKASAESSSDSIKEETDNLKKLSESDLGSMDKQIAGFKNKLENFRIKPDEGHSYDSWKNQIEKLDFGIKEYESTLESIKSKGGIFDANDEAEIARIKKSIEDMVRTMQKTSTSERGWTDIGASKTAEKIYSILEKNTKMSKSAREQIRAYYDEIRSGNPSAPLNDILNKCIKIEQQERAMGNAGRTWLDIFKDKKIYSFLGQAASMFSFYDLINVGRKGIDTLKEFDDGLTKISYTMDITKSQLNSLGKSIVDMSKDIDSSISNALQVSQIYANMNTSAEEIKRLSEPTLILSNLTGFDAATVADDIQAVTQQFEIAAEDSMHIADVYDQISRNISVDYSKGIESIAEAVQVAGSTAKQAGLDFEQLAAIVGKTVEKTRLEGSQVGNGLKTIMTRLSKVGELSDEVDNETLSQASESLHKVGVEVYNLDGSFRQFDTIMGELAVKWVDLSDAEKSNISFAIAATRQTNLLSAVLSNFSDSMALAEEASNSNGNALENNQKWIDSFGGHLQSLENTAQSAWINILDSNEVKTGIDVLNGLLKVVVKLFETFGIVKPAIAAFVAVLNKDKSKQRFCPLWG